MQLIVLRRREQQLQRVAQQVRHLLSLSCSLLEEKEGGEEEEKAGEDVAKVVSLVETAEGNGDEEEEEEEEDETILPGSNARGVVGVDQPLGHMEAEEEAVHMLLSGHLLGLTQSDMEAEEECHMEAEEEAVHMLLSGHLLGLTQSDTSDRSSAAPKEEKEEEMEEKEEVEARSGHDPPPSGARSCLTLIATSARAQSALLAMEEAMQLHPDEQAVEEERLGTQASACPSVGGLVAGVLGLLDSMPSPPARVLTTDQTSSLVAAAFRDRVCEIAQIQKDLTDLLDTARDLLDALPSPHARALASDLAHARTPISAALRERVSTPLLPPDNAPGAAGRGEEGRELLIAGSDAKRGSCGSAGNSAGNNEMRDAGEGENGGGDDQGDGVHASAATARIVPPPTTTTLPNMHPVLGLPCTESAALLALVRRPTNTETETETDTETQGGEGRETDTRVGSEAEVDAEAVDEASEVRRLKEDAALQHLVYALVDSALRSFSCLCLSVPRDDACWVIQIRVAFA
jgi:hypothetical protein